MIQREGIDRMSLPENIYKMLEGVVGKEYISDRPHILAAYRHTSPQDGRKPASPDAVVLPGNTEEVQAVVRICRKCDIQCDDISLYLFNRAWCISSRHIMFL